MGTTARAVEIFLETKERAEGAIKRSKSENESKKSIADMEKALRTRARSVPALVLTHGLTSTLAFLCSKADKDFYNYLMRGVECQKLPGTEEVAYTIYLTMLVRFLREDLGVVISDEWDGLIRELGGLDGKPQVISAINDVFYEFLLELKRVAEAALQVEGS